jgi:hypothetical protein
MAALSPARLLAVWEMGARRHPIDRALLLFAQAEPALDPAQLADLPLGQRNAAILGLRTACFGTRLAAWVDCPACAERMSFELDPAQLPPRPAAAPGPVQVGGHRFMPPTSRHLAIAAGAADAGQATLALMRACLADPPADDATLEALADAAGDALDAADPWADLSLALTCPACAAPVAACFDIAAYVWDELDTHARGLLDDIHTLAGAYGWREDEILALGEARRAAYLERVRA